MPLQRCCWDHHPGYTRARIVASPTAFPDRSISLLVGGDGIADVESAVESVNDSLVVCRSYPLVPGYVHTDDLLLSFTPSCLSGAIVDTRADFTFSLDTRAMQLVDVVPWGGPLLGGTVVVVRAVDLGGRRLRCRFGHEMVDAVYVDRTTLRCTTPWVGEPMSVPLEVSPDDGATWTLPLNFTYYETAVPRVSAVWPLGGPDLGGGVVTVYGTGFIDYRGRGEGLRVGLGLGERAHWLRTHAMNSSMLLAWTVNVSNASAVRGERIVLVGGGFDDGGTRPVARGGDAVRVTLNGDLRVGADIVDGVNLTYRAYPHDELRVSEVFPHGAHHAGGTEVTLYGAGFVNLGEPLCAFGHRTTTRGALPLDPASGDGNTSPWNVSEPIEIVTPATVLGPHEALCTSPSIPNHPTASVPIELILNGDRATKTRDGRPFTIYGQPGAEVRVSSISPLGAPVSGGTLLTIHGRGLLDLGEARVRIGKLGAVQARVDPSGHNLTFVTPIIARPGLEPLAVSADGATFTRAGIALRIFDVRTIAISGITPQGGPSDGGTRIVVRGTQLEWLPAACVFSETSQPLQDSAVDATVINSTHAACMSPQFSANGSQTVSLQLTLNGERSEPRLARGTLQFAFYDASAVRIDSIAPQGGPAEGGTLVVIRGAGYVDRGGLFCRFGADPSSMSPATLHSSTELSCLSTPRTDSTSPLSNVSRYVRVHTMASCCLDPATASRLGGSPAGTAAEPADCEAGCTALSSCRFFSHSFASSSCDYCADCAFENATDVAAQRSSWQRLGPTRSDVPVRLVLNGVAVELLPELSLSPSFTYYLPQALVLSAALPVGGPVAGGTVVTVHGIGFAPLTDSLPGPRCMFGELGPVDASIASDGSSLRCASPMQPQTDASLLSVRSVNSGFDMPPEPRSGISHRWTTDGCSGVGASHERHCTPTDSGRAAIMCCALDSSRCQSMCVSAVDRARYPLTEPGGLTGSFAPFSEAEAVCDELMMRVCTLRDLDDGLCCGGGCAFDDARVWSSDDCTLPSEHSPIDALALRAELLRVSINGQQYNAAYEHFDAPARPNLWSGLATPVPGFTYYDAARHVALSAITPSHGPAAGGTLVTLFGVGFTDLGARVGFLGVNGTYGHTAAVMAPATLAFGALRGRTLTCRTPPSPMSGGGAARVELSLNGHPLPPAMSDGSSVRFAFDAEGGSEEASGDSGSGSGD